MKDLEIYGDHGNDRSRTQHDDVVGERHIIVEGWI